jgi:hypothetical protein
MTTSGAAPCIYCGASTTTSLPGDGPICGQCLKAYMRGRAIGVNAAIDTAKHHQAASTVLDALKRLL